jgi:hypothetical protein
LSLWIKTIVSDVRKPLRMKEREYVLSKLVDQTATNMKPANIEGARFIQAE